MDKLLTDFSWNLIIWQLFNLALVILFVYVIVLKYVNARQKMLNKQP